MSNEKKDKSIFDEAVDAFHGFVTGDFLDDGAPKKSETKPEDSKPPVAPEKPTETKRSKGRRVTFILDDEDEETPPKKNKKEEKPEPKKEDKPEDK